MLRAIFTDQGIPSANFQLSVEIPQYHVITMS